MPLIDHPDASGGPAFAAGLVDCRGRLSRLHKGGAPSQTKTQKELEKEQLKLTKQNLEDAKKPVEMPEIKMPDPAPPAPPPVSQSSADVTDAEQQARRNTQRRTNAGRNTIFAGETGNALGGRRTILG